MNYHGLFKNENLPQIRVALVGVGDFGATLLDQARNIEKIDITVICDKDEPVSYTHLTLPTTPYV